MGSRVPAWPTLRVPARRRTRATTSWEVSPPGLSTRRSPSGVVVTDVAGLLVGVGVPGGAGLLTQARQFGVALGGLAQHRLEGGSGLGDLIEHEVDRGGDAHAEMLADLRADHAPGGGQGGGGTGAVRCLAKDRVEHRGVLQVAGYAHV